MNSYILKNQEPLSNRWGIEVVTFGNNMTFLGSSRTYGLLSTQGALWLKYAVLLPKFFFFQSGFPSSLKQFSGPDLCKYSGSRPVWRLRPWHRAGSPEGGQEALQGVKFYLSF